MILIDTDKPIDRDNDSSLSVTFYYICNYFESFYSI